MVLARLCVAAFAGLDHWAAEDAAWIISADELRSSQTLRDDTVRNEFIDTFWVPRDPTRPVTRRPMSFAISTIGACPNRTAASREAPARSGLSSLLGRLTTLKTMATSAGSGATGE